jgi:hypothetical protein
VGAGDGLGSAIARRFARGGYVAALARRGGEKLEAAVKEIEAAGGRAQGFGVDARREDAVVELFDAIERELGPIEVAVHNIGANVNFSILEMDARKYTKVWEMACFSGFPGGRRPPVAWSRAAAARSCSRARPRACAAVPASPPSPAPSTPARARAVDGPRARAAGIHVGHVVVDGPIDMPWIRENFPDLVASRPADGLLAPDDIAESYWTLHAQPRSAWTHELDVRPWVEKF